MAKIVSSYWSFFPQTEKEAALHARVLGFYRNIGRHDLQRIHLQSQNGGYGQTSFETSPKY